MKWFRIFAGVLMLTSSVAGDATGKVGKNGFGAAELGSQKGQATASFIHDTTYGLADTWTEKGWTDNTVIDVVTDMTYTVGDLSEAAGNLCTSAKRLSRRFKGNFASLEQSSDDLNKTSKNLLRDHQYRDWKEEEFALNYKQSSESSQLENDKEDWVLLTEEPEVFFDAVDYQA